MSKLLVLGGSPAAIKAVELIRANDSEIEITIMTLEGCFPYKRDVFANVMQKKASVEDVHCRDKKFYAENNISVLTDQKVTRVNLKTKKIHTEEKKQYDFDQIILAEMPEGTIVTPLKGGRKEGIYVLRKIKYVDKLIKELPFYETVILESDTFAGLQAAEALVKQGKEVYLIVPTKSPFFVVEDEDARESILNSLREKGLYIVEGVVIDEILGDEDVKAVRLSSGKVLAADIIVLGESKDDLKLISEFGVNIVDGRIGVDENYQTSLTGVYAVDGLVDRHAHKWWSDFSMTKSLEDQGARIAAHLTNQEYTAETFVAEKSFELEGVTVSFVHGSHVNELNGCKCFIGPESCGYVGVLTLDNIVKAVWLINCDAYQEAVKGMIVGASNIETMVEALGLQATDEDEEIQENQEQSVEPSINESNA